MAILYIQNSQSPEGLAAYNYTVSNGIPINYNASNKCSGKSQGKNKPILVPPSTCGNGTPTYIAGTIAHEVFHIKTASPKGSKWEEYQAMHIGDIVRNDLIQAGYGNSSDMRNPLSIYTVNLNNPNQAQLKKDLDDWIKKYEPTYTQLQTLP